MNTCTRINYFVLLLVITLAWASCRKYNNETPAGETQLIVSFSTASVPIASTDSITVRLINGTDTVQKKAIRAGSFYSVSLKGLKSSTTYTTLTKVYTSADTLGLRHMYRLEGTVDTQTGATVSGPTAKLYDMWKACYIYYNATYNVSFAMAASPADPYFELTLPASLAYKYAYIDRNLYKTIANVKYPVKSASAIFKTADYKGFHVNSTSFAAFATQSTAVTYDAGDFSLQLYNEANNDYKILVFQAMKF